MKKFAFLDVDKTIYDGYSTPDFLKFLGANNVIDQKFIAEMSEKDAKYLNKEITYDEVVIESTNIFANAVKGLKEAEEFQFYEDEFFQKQGRLYFWVPKVLDFLYENSFEIILVSATVHPILDTFARFLPVTNYFGSELEIENGVFTGKVLNILNSDAKTKKVLEFIADLPEDTFTISFGDSVGDIPMLSSTKLSFVINAHDELVVKIAKEKGWIMTMDGEEMVKIIKSIVHE